jgi:hypothetical protein
LFVPDLRRYDDSNQEQIGARRDNSKKPGTPHNHAPGNTAVGALL